MLFFAIIFVIIIFFNVNFFVTAMTTSLVIWSIEHFSKRIICFSSINFQSSLSTFFGHCRFSIFYCKTSIEVPQEKKKLVGSSLKTLEKEALKLEFVDLNSVNSKYSKVSYKSDCLSSKTGSRLLSLFEFDSVRVLTP